MRTRAATIADAAAIAESYNQGIADRIATFETQPRSAPDIAEWFAPQHLVMVAEAAEIRTRTHGKPMVRTQSSSSGESDELRGLKSCMARPEMFDRAC